MRIKPILYTATLIKATHVIPAKAGIQENTGFPRIKYGAGLIKPGMTNLMGIMSSCVNQQNGMALVIALVMLLVLTLVGLSAVSMTNFETNISGNQRVYNLAFYTADGGIENFRGRVSGGEFIYSAVSTGSYQVGIGGNACNVSYNKWNRKDAEGDFTVFKITSEGRAPFPSTGRVTIESIIEVLTTIQPGYN